MLLSLSAHTTRFLRCGSSRHGPCRYGSTSAFVATQCRVPPMCQPIARVGFGQSARYSSVHLRADALDKLRAGAVRQAARAALTAKARMHPASQSWCWCCAAARGNPYCTRALWHRSPPPALHTSPHTSSPARSPNGGLDTTGLDQADLDAPLGPQLIPGADTQHPFSECS